MPQGCGSGAGRIIVRILIQNEKTLIRILELTYGIYRKLMYFLKSGKTYFKTLKDTGIYGIRNLFSL